MSDVWINADLFDDEELDALPAEDWVRFFKACVAGETNNPLSIYVRTTSPYEDQDEDDS